MKINMPVTEHEVKLREGQELVTKTNLKGIITYVNADFIEVSGFSEQELMGKNHNVVRHPDMPQAAFKDLWETLQLGRPWCKLVKNRCKNGDYYWVKANVTPIFRDGQIVEYMSVRTKPTQEEIEQAERFYRALNEGKAQLPPAASISRTGIEGQLHKWIALSTLIFLVLSGVLYALDAPPLLLLLGPLAAFITLAWSANHHLNNAILRPISQVIDDLKLIGEGYYHHDIELQRSGEIGELKRAVKMMQIKLGFEVNNARSRATEALRIKAALDNVSSNVMLADNQGTIFYMNEAVEKMMGNAEEAIRRELPEFSVAALRGANFDSFHRNPAHQRNLLASLTSTHRSRIRVGGRTFDLVANPIINEAGERLGTSVEWQDVTDQLDAERQVEQLIQRAAAGELEGRIDAVGYQGFMKTIAVGINQLLDNVVSPIQEASRVLSALAEGDLTQKMEGDYQGEFARLNDAINSSLAKLSGMVAEIRQAEHSITVGASEIAQGNATLSQRTEEQAASLQETAASMEQMTSTVRQNADNAQQANQLAASAREQAEQGGRVAQEVTAAMAGISQSSKKIAEIIGVIDEIAFQTNLLALNAAVEAARAGEQGRGFAVVASEVRNLAQRSASAAKEIKELIKDSVDKVEAGTQLVDASAEALQEIIVAIKKVSDIVGEIAAASQEQANGIAQVNQAVAQMDEGTQQNAALVEQAAAASESMDEQARHLQSLMSFFKVAAPETPREAEPQAVETLVRSLTPQPRAEQPTPAAARKARPAPVEQVPEDDEWEEF